MSAANNQQDDPGNKALLASLESVVMDLNDMENMIENFDESAAESFFSKVNEYIMNLKEVEKRAPACHLQVPHGALERVDDDLEQNPEVFAQELLARCKDESGQLNARVLGIKKVRQIVMDGWKPESGATGRDSEGGNPAPTAGTTEANGVGNGEGVAAGSQSGGAQGAPALGTAGVLPRGVGGKAPPGHSS